MNNQRESNFELLRVVSMIMIVLSHCIYFGVVRVGQPDAYVLWGNPSLLYKIISSTSILGTIGVGLFFMISGYFTAHKDKTRIKKVCLISLFYAFLAILVMIFTKVGGMPLYSSNSEYVLDACRPFL